MCDISVIMNENDEDIDSFVNNNIDNKKINLIEILTDKKSKYMPCDNLEIFFEDIILLDRIKDSGLGAIFIVLKKGERYMLEIHKVIKKDYTIFDTILNFSGKEGFIEIERFVIDKYDVYKTTPELLKSNYLYFHTDIKQNFNKYVGSNMCAFSLFKVIEGYTLDRILNDLNTKELCLILDKLLFIVKTIKDNGYIHNNLNKYNIICNIEYTDLLSFLQETSSDNIDEYNNILYLLKDGITSDKIVNLTNEKISEIYKKSIPNIKVTLLNNFHYHKVSEILENYSYELSDINSDVTDILDIITHKIYNINIFMDRDLHTIDTMYLKSNIKIRNIIKSKFYRILKTTNYKLTDKDILALFRASHTRDYMNLISNGFIRGYKIEYRLPITVINNLYQNVNNIDFCIDIVNIFKESILRGKLTFNKSVLVEISKNKVIGVRKDLKLLA